MACASSRHRPGREVQAMKRTSAGPPGCSAPPRRNIGVQLSGVPQAARTMGAMAGSPARRRGDARRIHLVASPGGHLALLERLSGCFRDAERVWVTLHGPHAEDLRQAGEAVVV